MQVSRFVGAALSVWIVRVLLNGLFYTQIMAEEMGRLSAERPGLFREVIPAYIAGDLLFAVVFSFLLVKSYAAFGGGVKAGVLLGLLVAILSPVLALWYQYYSFTFLPASLVIVDGFFQIAAHVVQGAVAGFIYKTTSPILA